MKPINPTRRQFLIQSSAVVGPALIGGCSVSQQNQEGSSIRLVWKYDNPACVCSDPNTYTPFGRSVCDYFASTGKSTVSVVYRGQLKVSKIFPGGMSFDSGNRRVGDLTTTIRYRMVNSSAIEASISQKLNGTPLGTIEAPFNGGTGIAVFSIISSTAVRFSDLPEAEPFSIVDLLTGIGAPEIAKTMSKGDISLSLKSVGSKFVVPLNQAVGLWRWSGVHTNGNRTDYIQSKFDNRLSSAIPGQLESYSYQYIKDGRVVDESSGQIVDIS